MLTVHSEPVYALLDIGVIPDIMSERLAKNLKLEIEPTDRSIIVANETKVNVQWMVTNVSVGFGNIVARMKFLVM